MANGFVINARSLNRRMSGVERYAIEVSDRLAGRIRLASPGKRMPPPFGHFWEQFILPASLAKGELLWSPANTGPLAVSDQVLTVHDLSALEHPEWFQPWFSLWYRILLPRLVRQVSRVLTVSETSRQRILKKFDLSKDKVIAIPGGVDTTRFKPTPTAEVRRVRQRYGLAEAYALFLGTLEPRKNLGFLTRVWSCIQHRFPHAELAIAGSIAPHFAALPYLPDNPGVRWLGYVAESDLPALYSGASAYLQPSLEEGFGLTPLEAMACGTPVIAANRGALPEILGSAAVLLDPQDIAGWGAALSCALSGEDYRQDFAQRGLERARQFSWDRTAEQVWQALENA